VPGACGVGRLKRRRGVRQGLERGWAGRGGAGGERTYSRGLGLGVREGSLQVADMRRGLGGKGREAPGVRTCVEDYCGRREGKGGFQGADIGEAFGQSLVVDPAGSCAVSW
jgi:hypothetical protein